MAPFGVHAADDFGHDVWLLITQEGRRKNGSKVSLVAPTILHGCLFRAAYCYAFASFR